MKRFLLLYPLPATLCLLVAVGSLVAGTRTLFLRDVLNAHFGIKAVQAEALRHGNLPLVLPELAGGQPLVGNPNAVPLYPDNLLYLVAPTTWAFNAHFWLHLLLAPWAMFWLARRWGLGHAAAWAAGVAYGLSGFFLSQLTFYNLVALSALAPALVAAALALAAEPTARAMAAFAGLWALLLLAGEPLVAGLALVVALSAVAARDPRREAARTFAGPGLFALVCGSLLAAPQLVELARILPLSTRGHRGFSSAVQTVGSFAPSHLGEWFLPLVFGRPDQVREGTFWAYPFFGNQPPIFFSLAPGLLVLALVLVSGFTKSRARFWAWGLVFAGVFVALGANNPLLAAALDVLPGAKLLRFPVKVWLAPAMGLALLAGLGFERAFGAEAPARRRLTLVLAGLAAAYLAFIAWWVFAPGTSLGWLRSLVPPSFGAEFLGLEHARWTRLLAAGLLLTLAGAATALASRRFRENAGAFFLALHVASQLLLLAPLYATDELAAYETPPELARHVPEGSFLANAVGDELFGQVDRRLGTYPAWTAQWLQRRSFADYCAWAALAAGRRVELNLTPEGLSSFLTRAARDAVRQADDASRLRLLASWGVDRLIVDRELEAAPSQGLELLAQVQSFGGQTFVYRLPRAAPPVSFASEIRFAPHMNAALSALVDPGFDPGTMVVLPGPGPTQKGQGGEVLAAAETAETLTAEVRAQGPGALVWQRSHLALYRAKVDGEPAPILFANLHRMAVPIPPGQHKVEIAIDRRPTHAAWLAALLGALLVLRRVVAERGEAKAPT